MKEHRSRPVIDEGAPSVRILFTMAPICLLVIANQVALCEARCLHDWRPAVLIERTCGLPTASDGPRSIGHHFHTGVNVHLPWDPHAVCTHTGTNAALCCSAHASLRGNGKRGER